MCSGFASARVSQASNVCELWFFSGSPLQRPLTIIFEGSDSTAASASIQVPSGLKKKTLSRRWRDTGLGRRPGHEAAFAFLVPRMRLSDLTVSTKSKFRRVTRVQNPGRDRQVDTGDEGLCRQRGAIHVESIDWLARLRDTFRNLSCPFPA